MSSLWKYGLSNDGYSEVLVMPSTDRYRRNLQKIRIMICRRCKIKTVVPLFQTSKRCPECKRRMHSRIEYREFDHDDVTYDGTGTIERRYGETKGGGRFRDQVRKR